MKVIAQRSHHMLTITLNRPQVINSLDHEMIRSIQKALDEAETSSQVKLIVFVGKGEKGFCAGGDIKALSQAVISASVDDAMGFLGEEYALDLRIHRFPKPVIVIADGITMGGGLGLAAGGDIVVATEGSLMAMPETRIGFFPDVGSSGWLFTKCPKGYPEFLSLTGYEMAGVECVRLGLASHLVLRKNLEEAFQMLERCSAKLPLEKPKAVQQLCSHFESLKYGPLPQEPEMDEWVKTYFAGKSSLKEILADLSQCKLQNRLCEGVFQRLSERSPAALVLTLKLLRHNEGRPLEEVFLSELRAAHFIMEHPDYPEGVRARLVDKDDNPRWQPDTIDKVGAIEVVL